MINNEDLEFWASLDLDSLSTETEWENLLEIIEDEGIDLDFIDQESTEEFFDPYADDYDFYEDGKEDEVFENIDDYLDSLLDDAEDEDEEDGYSISH